MSGQSYMGIPREAIPWFPTIDAEACLNDRACLDFCANDVFVQGATTTIVANPLNCVVGCSACAQECPVDAITFPDKGVFVETLGRLREHYAELRSA